MPSAQVVLLLNTLVMSGQNHRFLCINRCYGERHVHRAPIVRFQEPCGYLTWLGLAVDRVRFKSIRETRQKKVFLHHGKCQNTLDKTRYVMRKHALSIDAQISINATAKAD